VEWRDRRIDPQIRLLPTILRVYKIYLTYLLTHRRTRPIVLSSPVTWSRGKNQTRTCQRARGRLGDGEDVSGRLLIESARQRYNCASGCIQRRLSGVNGACRGRRCRQQRRAAWPCDGINRINCTVQPHSSTRRRTDNLHTRSTHTAVSRYGELTPSRGVSLWGVVKRRAGGAGGVGGAKRECGR